MSIEQYAKSLDKTIARIKLNKAAPDLLAVCEEIVAYDNDASRWGFVDVPHELLDKVKAAIAKAKGKANESEGETRL